MQTVLQEIYAQPDALLSLKNAYFHEGMLNLLDKLPANALNLLTGMGASHHAALHAVYHMRSLGAYAHPLEAADLIYHPGLISGSNSMTFISQSGDSGEIQPVLAHLSPETELIGITNHAESFLANRASIHLPLAAGEETLIASKTYVNTIALLWLMVRKLHGAWNGSEEDALARVANAAAAVHQHYQSGMELWSETLADKPRRIFLGHTAFGITARHSSMMVAEWAKEPVLAFSIGAFRHGYIEIVQPGTGVVIFTGSNETLHSSLMLAEELESYGADVILVNRGISMTRKDFKPAGFEVDEFLSPILDVLPAQLFAVELAQKLNVTPSFRHISKVVTRL